MASRREERLWSKNQTQSEGISDFQVSSLGAASLQYGENNRQSMNNTESLEFFTRRLTRGVNGPLAKLRVIFTWIATNIAYDVEAFIRGHHTPLDTQNGNDVLRIRKATCSGYSDLLQSMSRVSGIECRKIQGHVKGAGYLPGQTFSPNVPNHEWNAVFLEGRWYLVDVCWCSGYLHQVNKQFVFKFSEHYFLTDPEVFVEDHLPLEDFWQLLEKPHSLDEFQEAVHYKQGFFQYGIHQVFPMHGFVHVDKEVDISIDFPYPLTLTYELKHLELDSEFSKCVNFCIDNSKAEFCIRPPTTGFYTFKLYGKMRGCKDEPVALTTHTLDVVRVCPVAPSWRDLRFPWGPTRHFTHYSLEEVGSSRSCLTLEDGVFENTFKFNPLLPVSLKPLLYKAVNGKLKSCEAHCSIASQCLKSNHHVVRTTPPSPGHYWLTIYASTISRAIDETYECVANYMICSKEADFAKDGELPETTRWRHDCQFCKEIFISPVTAGESPMKSQISIYDKKPRIVGNTSASVKALATVGFARMGFGGIESLANLLILLCARIRDQSHRGYLRLLRYVID